MIKKTITFEDLDGNKVTDDFYFHMSKAELAELELSTKGGLEKYIEQIVAADERAEIVRLFRELIKLSVGKRGLDGRQFIKNDQVRDEFMQTDAYSVLFMELATDADAGSAFVNGIVPQGLTQEVSDRPQPQVVSSQTPPPLPEQSQSSKAHLEPGVDLNTLTPDQLRERMEFLQSIAKENG